MRRAGLEHPHYADEPAVREVEHRTEHVSVDHPTTTMAMIVGAVVGALMFIVGIAAVVDSGDQSFGRQEVEVFGAGLSPAAGAVVAIVGALVVVFSLTTMIRAATGFLALGALAAWVLVALPETRADAGISYGWTLRAAILFTVATLVLASTLSHHTTRMARFDQDARMLDRY